MSANRRPATKSADATASRAWTVALLLLGVTLLGAVLRLLHGADPSLRLDEAQSIQFASLPLRAGGGGQSLFQATAVDVQPPLFLVLLHGWMAIAGTSVAALRLPSETAGTLCVPALFLLGRALRGARVGLIAALLGALSPMWIWHAQEVRMYPLLLLTSIVATWGLVEALERGHHWGWPVFALATSAALYTHYFAAMLLGAQLLYVAVHLRVWRRRQLVALGASLALVGISYVPWLAELARYHHGANDPALHAPTLYTPLVVLSDFLFGYLSTPLTSLVVAGWPILVLLLLVVGVTARPPRAGRLPWVLLLAPVVITVVASVLWRPLLSERYLIICTPALYVLVATALARLRARPAAVSSLAAVGVLLLSAGSIEHASAQNPAAEDFRGVVDAIQAHAQPGDVVGLDSYYNQYPYTFYADNNLPTYPLPFAPPELSGTAQPALTEATLAARLEGIEAGHSRLWVVYYLEGSTDPQQLVRHYLDYHTAGHVVITGSDHPRNDPSAPASSVNVQLVLYTLVPHPALAQQPRPWTVAELRQVSGQTPTLRDLHQPSGTPGAAAVEQQAQLPAPTPRANWAFPALRIGARGQSLHLFNPNRFPLTVDITPQTGPTAVTTTIVVPPQSDIDATLPLTDAGPTDAPLHLAATAPFIPVRESQTTDGTVDENGLPSVASFAPTRR